MPCNCYVSYLTAETQFGLHFGAHNPSCPVYRPSLDPVDRANDEEFRRKVEIGSPRPVDVELIPALQVIGLPVVTECPIHPGSTHDPFDCP